MGSVAIRLPHEAFPQAVPRADQQSLYALCGNWINVGTGSSELLMISGDLGMVANDAGVPPRFFCGERQMRAAELWSDFQKS